jgi:anhydro-N-acetylmuramic acid kinase
VAAIGRWCGKPQEVFVCGGGARNQALMARLQQHLPDCRVAGTDFLGQPADWVEAVAFAWLAWRTLRGEAGNLAGSHRRPRPAHPRRDLPALEDAAG